VEATGRCHCGGLGGREGVSVSLGQSSLDTLRLPERERETVLGVVRQFGYQHDADTG
jgi:hypothetical protein